VNLGDHGDHVVFLFDRVSIRVAQVPADRVENVLPGPIGFSLLSMRIMPGCDRQQAIGATGVLTRLRCLPRLALKAEQRFVTAPRDERRPSRPALPAQWSR